MSSTITRHLIIFVFGLFLICTLCVADQGIINDIQKWREDIVAKEIVLSGSGLVSSVYSARLAKQGPNILPDLFAAYEKETDPKVLYHYQTMLKYCSRFKFFRYSSQPLEFKGLNLQCEDHNDLPFLSMEIGQNRLPVLSRSETIALEQDKLSQWWRQRSTFTKRKDGLDKIRTITGSAKAQFLSISNSQKREFEKLKVYGIYNIPYYIDAIEQDNNPAVFVEFLRISGHPEYQRLFNMSYDLAAFSRIADGAFPQKEEKLDLICKWWSEEKSKYINLTDLYNEINQRIEKIYPKTNENTVSDPNVN